MKDNSVGALSPADLGSNVPSQLTVEGHSVQSLYFSEPLGWGSLSPPSKSICENSFTHLFNPSFIKHLQVPGAGGTMMTKIPRIPALVGLKSKGAAGKGTNKHLKI